MAISYQYDDPKIIWIWTSPKLGALHSGGWARRVAGERLSSNKVKLCPTFSGTNWKTFNQASSYRKWILNWKQCVLRWKPCLRMWIKCDLLQMGVNGLCWHQCTRWQPTQRRLLEALPVHFRRKFWNSRNSNDCPCHIQVKPKHHKCQCDQ